MEFCDYDKLTNQLEESKVSVPLSPFRHLHGKTTGRGRGPYYRPGLIHQLL